MDLCAGIDALEAADADEEALRDGVDGEGLAGFRGGILPGGAENALRAKEEGGVALEAEV